MEPIYAMCLSASESRFGLNGSVHLSVKDGSRVSNVTLRWPDKHLRTEGMEAPAWLYAVLSHLVENFDDHDVVHIEVDTEEDQEVKNDA